MFIEREPIFVDIDSITDDIPQNTDSTDFVDVDLATLTTKDLGQDGTYKIFFSVLVSASLNNSKAFFRVLIDGVPTGAMDRPITLKVKELDIGYTFLGKVTNVPKDSVLQIQWATDQGTITLAEHNFLIDGIAEGRVV